MNSAGKRFLVFAVSLLAVCMVWAVDDNRIDAATAVAPDSELYAQQLNDKLDEFQLRSKQTKVDGVDGQEDKAREEAQLALIIFSEGISGCAASACVASACGGSGCAGSGCGGSGCAGSGCSASACAGSACAGSVCVGSACVGSACGASGCVGSGCGGSGCVSSGCGGSGCVGTGCAGSACQAGCRSETPYGGKVITASSGRITAFNVHPGSNGMEISWIATGSDVKGYRVYRGGATRTLIAEGRAQADRVVRVTDASGHRDARYEVEVYDITGRIIRIAGGAISPALIAIGDKGSEQQS